MKNGDVVKLRCGGPEMVVVEVINEIDQRLGIVGSAVETIWHAKNGSLITGTFRPEELMHADEDDVPTAKGDDDDGV